MQNTPRSPASTHLRRYVNRQRLVGGGESDPTFTMKNGCVAATLHVPHMSKFTLSVQIGVGSENEEGGTRGMAHVLEHMLFKGTEKYPEARDLSGRVDATGGHFNAYTNRTCTAYYVEMPKAHFDLACDLLSEMVWRPRLDEAEFNREKGPVQQELKRARDTAHRFAYDLLFDGMFERGFGQSIGGDVKHIQDMRYDTLRQFYKKYYVPSNITVCAFGHLPANASERLVTYFGSTTTPTDTSFHFKDVVSKAGKDEIREIRPNMKQVVLMMGWASTEYRSYEIRKRVRLELVSAILSGGMSSRLWSAVRERSGLAYEVSGSVSFYPAVAIYTLRIGCDAGEKEREVRETVKRAMHDDLSEDELTRAKTRLLGRHDMRRDEVRHELLLEHLRVRRRFKDVTPLPFRSLNSVEKIIQSVSLDDVKDTFRDFFKIKPFVVRIGPSS